MKKILLIVFLIVTCNSLVFAGPMVVCDYDINHDIYVVYLDDIEIFRGPPLERSRPCSHPLCEDGELETVIMSLTGVINDSYPHIIESLAINAWGDESDLSDPFEFILRQVDGAILTREMPAPPATIRLSLN